MIKILNNLDNQESLVPVFGTRGYMMSLEGTTQCGYAVEGDRVLPFLVKQRKIFKIIQIPCVACGCVDLEDKQRFIDNAIKCICESVSPDVIYTLNTNICSVYPTNSEYCKFASYIIDLTQTEDEIFNRFHTKHRNVVRKAIKDGLIVCHGDEYAEACYDIIKQTYERQGSKAGDNNEFVRLRDVKNVDYWVVKSGEDIQGCAVLLWSKGFASYYLHGGSISHPHGGALNLLHWEAIKAMKQRGVLHYDFVGARIKPDEGSKLEGIQRFKSRFGGDMEIGYMWRYINHPVMYFLYKSTMMFYLRYIKGNKVYSDIINEERKKGNY